MLKGLRPDYISNWNAEWYLKKTTISVFWPTKWIDLINVYLEIDSYQFGVGILGFQMMLVRHGRSYEITPP
jgi:hypothetical protein